MSGRRIAVANQSVVEKETCLQRWGVAVLLIGMLSSPAVAQSRSSMPRFTGKRVYVSDVNPRQWESLEAEIANVEKQSKQTYYVVVVNSSGNRNSAAPYTDRLYSQWRQQAANNPLDPKRSVLIVLAIKSRQLAVHAGSTLQQKYGLRGQTIDRQLVVPHFIPYAKAQDHRNGMMVLIQQIEKWIANVDQKEVRRKQQAVVRAKKIKQDARATIVTARQLFGEIEQLVKAEGTKAETALDYSRLQTRARQAIEDIPQIENAIEKNGAAALKDATQVQQALASVRTEIRQMAATQHDAELQLAKANTQIAAVAEVIEKHSVAGLAVGPSSDKLAAVMTTIRKAERMLGSDPRQSLQVANSAAGQLNSLQQSAAALPSQREALKNGFDELAKLNAKADQQLNRVKKLSGDVSSSKKAMKKASDDIEIATDLADKDYTQALALQQTSRSGLQAQLNELQQKGDRLYFVRRTVPKWVAIGLVSLGLLSLLILRILHLRKRKPLESKLSQFKTKVVDLSDSLDNLKERHRMLPYTDEDFKEPMTGETLEVYSSVQESLETFRQRWLTLMDIWEKSQEKMDAEHFFGRKKLAEATQLVETAPVDDVLHSIKEECIATLDLLEDAHEQQQHTEETLNESLQRLNQQLADVRKVDLATDPYDIELRTALDQRDAIVDQRVADPIGTRAVYDHTLSEVRRIGRWTEQILHHYNGTGEMAEKLDEVVASTDKHREMGFRFCEEGTDPAVLFPKIRHHRSECLTLLNTGEAKTAAEHLSQGFGLIASAKERIQRQVECKELCANERKLRPEEASRLCDSLQAGQSALTELDLSYADSSWNDVADNIFLADQTINECDQLIRDAATKGDDDVQFYVSATELYERIQQQQNSTASMIAAVEQRLTDLEALRERTQQEIISVGRLGDSVRNLLDSHEADRAAANQRAQQAEMALANAEEQTRITKVDWQDVLDQVGIARQEFESSERMAQEDIRLASQGATEIAQADREIRSASSFYQEGYTANVSTAESQVSQARAALNSRDYEQAIRLANQAASSARDAYRDAENSARRKRRDRERRRRERERAAFSASSLSSSSSSFGSSGFGSSSSSGSFSSGSSSSSWSSGTSSSSW